MTAPAVYQERYAKADAKRREAARELLEYHLSGIRRWFFAHRRADGHPFFMVYGSEPNPYYVDLHDCTCDSHRRGRVACKHMLAVRLWFDGVKSGLIPLPGQASQNDNAIMEDASVIAEALDIAEAADALLDKYDALQAAARHVEPAVDWWTTDDGGIVWLTEGDVVTHDDLVARAAAGDGAVEEGLAELEVQQQTTAFSTDCRLRDNDDELRDTAPTEQSKPQHPIGLVRSYKDLFGPEDD